LWRGFCEKGNTYNLTLTITIMKRILLLTILFAGFGFTAKGQPPVSTPNDDPNAPVMVFEEDTIQFGTVAQGTVVEKKYTFKNTGKTPLVITNATAPCGCTVPEFPKEPIAPGKTGVITVRFNSTGKMGVQDKVVTITSNNRDGSVEIHLQGTVTNPPPAPAPAGNK
jgi:hypothetical protein